MKNTKSSMLFGTLGVLFVALGIYVYSSGYPNLIYVLALVGAFAAALYALLRIIHRNYPKAPTPKAGLLPLIKGALAALGILAVLFAVALFYSIRAL